MTPVRIVTGHYGSGKTEFAVSLALALAGRGRSVALGDLDVVNPYFRSRERAGLMEAHGIRVISSTLGHSAAIEVPAISAEIRAPIADPATDVILDLGGDAVGAKALALFRADVLRRGYELLLVVNAHRPETRTADDVLRYLGQIEAVTTLKVSGLVSNTHLLRSTTTSDVVAGLELCREVSRRTGVPIRYVSAIPSALAGLPPDTEGERLAVGLYLRDEWM